MVGVLPHSSDKLVKLAYWSAVAALLLFSRTGLALDILPYDPARFAQAQTTGNVTVLQFHSGWCPICIMQERGVKELKEGKDAKALERVTVFVADFLKDAELRQRFSVTTFATLVVFRGTEEKARATGDFQPDKLRQLFDKAL